MPVYRHSGGSVTRSHLRARVGGSVLGAGRRIRNPIVDPPPVPTGSMTYTAEPLGAGGWVTGMSISPDGLTRLARTDTMGAWRWDTTADAWEPSIAAGTMPGDGNDMDSGEGVNAILATNAASFMAYRSRIYRSTDKGQNWSLVLSGGPTTAPNMGNQRWWNTRMAADPNNPAVIIYGTVNAGLYYTLDTGTTWTQVPAGSVPVGLDGLTTPGKQTYGIPCVAIDGSGNWYAAPFGYGVYKSTNHGSTWTKISSDSQFVVVAGMQAGPNGDLMVAAHTSTSTITGPTSVLYRYRSGTWAQLTSGLTGQGTRQWRTVAYDPFTAGRVLVQGDGGYERVSLDYGDTWNGPSHSMASDGDVPWLAAANGFGVDFFFVTIGGLQFDPVVSGRVWMSQGIGVWYADMPTSPTAVIPWHAQSRGIEQLVVNDALCPPGGAPVVTCWDRAIFLAGESSSAPILSIPTPATAPVHYPIGIDAALVAGYPAAITYAWTVVSKPVASSGGTFSATNTLSATFTGDVAGTYVLRLTATNATGTGTKDVTVTVAGSITALSLPGTTGNYLSTPESTDFDVTGSFTAIVKLSMANWLPSSPVTLIGKSGSLNTDRTFRLTAESVGFRVVLNGVSTSFTAFVMPASVPANGSAKWVRLVNDATAHTLALSISPDGSTWTLIKSWNPTVDMGAALLQVTSTPLTVGYSASVSAYLQGSVYRAQFYNGASLVADFNAESVTRTGTRTPATYTDSVGKVWTPQGTGWDWL